MMKSPLTGIIPPMVTPLKTRNELDVEGLEALIEHLLQGGVSGLFILGTTGEGPGHSYALRRTLIDRVCRQVAGRVPVLVGISDTAFEESINLAGHAAEAGASAVVAAPPFYYSAAQSDLRQYLDHLTAELALPLLLYNIPSLTKVAYDTDTLRQVLDNPRIKGFKDSSGDLDYFTQAVATGAQRPDWSCLFGPEESLLEALQAGAHGGIPGGANLFPGLYVELVNAFRNGRQERAKALQNQVNRVSASLYSIGQQPTSFIKAIKCGLSCLGICHDTLAEPLQAFRGAERTLLEARLAEIQTEIREILKNSNREGKSPG